MNDHPKLVFTRFGTRNRLALWYNNDPNNQRDEATRLSIRNAILPAVMRNRSPIEVQTLLIEANGVRESILQIIYPIDNNLDDRKSYRYNAYSLSYKDQLQNFALI